MRSVPGIFCGADSPTAEALWRCRERAREFNSRIRLEETVRVNENFYIGKQWEGVNANGLPTPVLNFLKRVVGFQVATITSSCISVTASALEATPDTARLSGPVGIVNNELERIAERVRLTRLIRVLARNAAVDGDGCVFSWWDAKGPEGGCIRSEVIENTRVYFGNPNSRDVQTQPWIMIESREPMRSVLERAGENGCPNPADIVPDEDGGAIDEVKRVGDRVTVLLMLFKDRRDGTVHAVECTRRAVIRGEWNTGLRLYPVVWFNWDYVADCYHGQSMLSGLIPNQIAVNKLWAMILTSVTRTAWPKVIYDRTRVPKWDNKVGGAIGINGGDVGSVARIMDPAVIPPQVSQLLSLLVQQTEETLGASAAALGDAKADNAAALMEMSRAATTPIEITKMELYECVEDLFRIYLEFMGNCYGKRLVDAEPGAGLIEAADFAGAGLPASLKQSFDFAWVREHPMTLRLDVGASSYFSEIQSMQRLENLLQLGKIDVVQYLERLPDGYLPRRSELINELLRQRRSMTEPMEEDENGRRTDI